MITSSFLNRFASAAAALCCLWMVSCAPTEKPIDPARLQRLNLTENDLDNLMAWTNLLTTREVAVAYLEQGNMPISCLKNSKDQTTFRECWSREGRSYRLLERHLDIVMDARWGKFFQWQVIWRCLLALVGYVVIGGLLKLAMDSCEEASVLGRTFGCLGALTSLVIALPAIWYLIVGLL